jgi:hypothetical protein
MSVDSKIELIQTKLQELRAIDPKYSVFGASNHKYRSNKVITESELNHFESKYGINLPAGFKSFLLKVGNGGAGPYYGLETIEDSLYVDLDYKRENEFLDPSVPFPINTQWNMKFTGDHENEEEYKVFEEKYFDSKWETGLLRICNYGCGVSLNLIVNGQEYGNIWVDDRGSDGGIYPDPYFDQNGRTNFLDWYLLWLEKSLHEVSSR